MVLHDRRYDRAEPHAPMREFVLLAVALNAFVGVGIALHPKLVLSATADVNHYLAIAYNIATEAKFYNPISYFTWPVGWPLLLSPAMLFQNPVIVFSVAYLVNLFWMNVLWWLSYRTLAEQLPARRALLLSTTLLGTLGFTGFFWGLYAETTFTVFLCLGLLAAVRGAEHRATLYWGAAGFLCAYATIIRPIGMGALVGVGLSLACLAWVERRIDFPRLAATAGGALLGAFPLALQRWSIWAHPEDYYAAHYAGFAKSYTGYLQLSFSDLHAVSTLFLPALWHELALLFQFTLGGIVVFLLLTGPVTRMLRNRETPNRVLLVTFAFVIGFLTVQVAQATVHTVGYIRREPELDRMSRYMMPASSLVLLALFLVLPREDWRARLLRWRVWAFAAALGFSAVLVFLLPFSSSTARLPNYGYAGLWIQKWGFTDTTTPFFLVLFPLLWMGRQVRWGWLAVVVAAVFVLPHATDLPTRRERGRTFLADVEHTMRANGVRLDGAEQLYLLYDRRDYEFAGPWIGFGPPIHPFYTPLFLKHDIRYRGMSYEAFNALREEEKSKAIVVIYGRAEISGCTPTRDARARPWIRAFDCGAPAGEPRRITVSSRRNR